MPGWPPGREKHDIETDRQGGRIRMAGEIPVERPLDSLPLSGPEGVCRGVGEPARLDLDRGERIAPSGQDIQLAHRRPQPPGQNPITLEPEQRHGQGLGGEAASPGQPATLRLRA